MRKFLRYAIFAFYTWSSFAVSAQETTTFTYDAKGRVTNVARSGGPSSGVSTTYSYDRADNRTRVQVTGAPAGSGAPTSEAPAISVTEGDEHPNE